MKMPDVEICSFHEELTTFLAKDPRLEWVLAAIDQMRKLAGQHQDKLLLANKWADCSAEVHRRFARHDEAINLAVIARYRLTIVDWVRWQLLADMLLVLSEEKRKPVYQQCLRYADDREKIGLMKLLSLTDMDGDLAEMVVNLCRTHNLELYAAIALDNTWPAEHFEDRAFEQLVLKSLFCDFDIGRIKGWGKRMTQRISQLLFDFICERYAAGRRWHRSAYAHIRPEDLNAEDQRKIANIIKEDIGHGELHDHQ